MIDTLIACSNMVFDFFSKKKIEEHTRKKEIAAILDHVAQLLRYVSEELVHDRYPYHSCEEMRVLANKLLDKIGEDFEEKKDLKIALNEASEFERLYAERNEEVIKKINEASGKFSAAAILIVA